MKKSLSVAIISVLSVLVIVFCALYITNNQRSSEQIDALNGEVADQAGQIAAMSSEAAKKNSEIEALQADVAERKTRLKP